MEIQKGTGGGVKREKIMPFHVERESIKRAEGERIVEVWRRVLAVSLDAEETAWHLAQLERWQERKPKKPSLI